MKVRILITKSINMDLNLEIESINRILNHQANIWLSLICLLIITPMSNIEIHHFPKQRCHHLSMRINIITKETNLLCHPRIVLPVNIHRMLPANRGRAQVSLVVWSRRQRGRVNQQPQLKESCPALERLR